MADRGRGRVSGPSRGRGRGRGEGYNSRGAAPRSRGPSTPSLSATGNTPEPRQSPEVRGRGNHPHLSANTTTAVEANVNIVRGTGGRGGRGIARGGGQGRALGREQGREYSSIPEATTSAEAISSSVPTLGARRRGYGTLGTPVQILINCFGVRMPMGLIYHYDEINPDVYERRKALQVIRNMQEQYPATFHRHGAYDGRKNLFSPVFYPFGDDAEFQVNDPAQLGRWRVRVRLVAVINGQIVTRYLQGKSSYEELVAVTLHACNVAVRTEPLRNTLTSGRSFFVSGRALEVVRGVEICRGYFQTVRPAMGKMLINIDITSASFFRSGPLINLCMEYLGGGPNTDPVQLLSADGLNAETRQRISRYIRNLKVRTTHSTSTAVRSIRGVSEHGANGIFFNPGDAQGPTVPVEAWILQSSGIQLQYPTLFSVQLSPTLWVPIELCEVLPGQDFRKTPLPEQRQSIERFSRVRPEVRLAAIQNSFQYEYSPQGFEISLDPNPVAIQGRILPPPTLKYGGDQTVSPQAGRWNMIEKTLYRPARIEGCGIIIYDQTFSPWQEAHLKTSLFEAARMLGVEGMSADPPVLRKDATGDAYYNHLREVGIMHRSLKGNLPNLIIVVLPESARNIYHRIKNAGDVRIGVATQCLQASRCSRGNEQYFVNVFLKINVKLGGVNVAPNPECLPLLVDEVSPTIVMGAHVSHPGPGITTWPSYSAVVGSVDSFASKYVATVRPQGCRVEMVQELSDMASEIIRKYMQARRADGKSEVAPQRILFYRKGLSFEDAPHAKGMEVPGILKACDKVGIPRPKLTYIIITKRHHIRFFPSNTSQSTRSGNAPAGLVVDRGVVSPAEYEFYLQSHTPDVGTSHSMRYNVIVDQNNFLPDDLQRITFTLCHLNMRSTRSNSVVAPVQYACMASGRARLYCDPDEDLGDDLDELPDRAQTEERFWRRRRAFQIIHLSTSQRMYFV